MDKLAKFKSAKYVFVIGIGGSNLASKAVYEAMTLHKNRAPKKLLFWESPDEREYAEIVSIVKKPSLKIENIALLVISKSGKTKETLETFHKTFDILKQKYEPEQINKRTLIITTRATPLSKIAEENNILSLEWEGDVGGRFSAFTIAHTAVLEIAGLDIERFKEGSHSVLTSRDEQEKLAREIFENYKKGVNILDFFIFNSELETLGKWCRQLVAESLATLTPTVSIGPTDMHSVLELYLDGPKNRYTIFICSLEEIDETINQSIFQEVSLGYQKAALPFMKYEMERIEEKTIGEFMAFMMEMTIKLADLLGLNPYDQPAIENYKRSITNF